MTHYHLRREETFEEAQAAALVGWKLVSVVQESKYNSRELPGREWYMGSVFYLQFDSRNQGEKR